MGLHFLAAAAAAALLVPADGLLSVHGLTSADRGHPKAPKSEEEMRKWLDKAAKENEELDAKTRAIMSELANTSLKEADPKTKQEMELKMLEDLLSRWDTENETSIDETARRMAAFAFRKAVRRHLRKPARKEAEVDAHTAEAMKSWMEEANRATKDLEKQLESEERDLGEAKDKGEEEKRLERLEDLIDGTDPKNASELEELAAALAQERKRPKRKARASSAKDSEKDAAVSQSMKDWVSEANKESEDLEKQTNSEESDLSEAVPKGDEEKELERLKELIDGVDVKNASEMADLATALAQARRRPARRARGQAASHHEATEADSKMVDAMKAWMEEANKESSDMEKETSAEESDLGEAVPKGEEEKSLERLKEVLDGVDPKNASEMADLASALAQRSSKRRPKRKSAPQASRDTSEADAKMVEAMKAWASEANKESQDLDKSAGAEESDLGEEVPKGEEEKELERLKDILDSVNTKNASEMADVDLRAALAQLKKRRPRRRVARKQSQSQDITEADAKMVDALKAWVSEANKESQDLEKQTDSEESDLGEAVPKGDEEKELERVKGLLDSVNPKNASEMADLDLAAALVKAKRRPKRQAQITEVDSKMVEAMKAWMAEANKESHDLEKETDSEESDLSEAVPKGAEEKEMERLKDLIDGVDAKNASDLAEVAAALAQARTLQAKLRPRRKEPDSEKKAKMGEEMKAWMAEADKATGELDKEIDATISELSEEIPKSEKEKEMERVQGLITSVDPENETQVADLSMKLAQNREFTRKVGKPPSPTAPDWTEADSKKFWGWLEHAQKASDKLDKELDSSEKEFVDYLAGMTETQERLMHGELKVLEEIWEKYGFQNESVTAEDVMEKLEAKGSQ